MLWGLLFLGLGEFDTLLEAVYHSGVNFATLGYGDIVMSPRWKLLGPLEAVNGAADDWSIRRLYAGGVAASHSQTAQDMSKKGRKTTKA
ncbi:Ion channel [Kluyvera cryocrescens]|uniref:Ion channel n=1 Tax=Kluyvera cryocrescens TaxID=580 RepID=A0A485AC37_KLUCR|nr:Ion channel [Kluyvera cryocrescens]